MSNDFVHGFRSSFYAFAFRRSLAMQQKKTSPLRYTGTAGTVLHLLRRRSAYFCGEFTTVRFELEVPVF
ncbi:MAG TPA: hypothetical protein VFT06_08085 [Flavisolibacter sp.]|nr:hypothetical protein [Flavisolibacter sp.]